MKVLNMRFTLSEIPNINISLGSDSINEIIEEEKEEDSKSKDGEDDI